MISKTDLEDALGAEDVSHEAPHGRGRGQEREGEKERRREGKSKDKP